MIIIDSHFTLSAANAIAQCREDPELVKELTCLELSVVYIM